MSFITGSSGAVARRLCAVALLLPGLALADVVTFTASGTLPGGTTSSTLSAPNVAFSLTFSLDDANLHYISPFNAATFAVEAPVQYVFGATTVSLSAGAIALYDDAGGGGLTVFLDDGTHHLTLSLGGPALFTGSAASPTFLTGTFAFPANIFNGVGVDTDNYDLQQNLGDASVTATSANQEVPEPASLALAGLALGAVAAVRRKRPAR